MSYPFQDQQQAPGFRSPVISVAIAVAWAYAACYLHELGLATGAEWTTPASLVAGALAVNSLIRGLDDQAKKRDARLRKEKQKEIARKHGEARFATLKDMRCGKLLGKRGIFLGNVRDGWFRRRDLLYDGECCVNVFGPPGSLKSMAIAAPTIIGLNESMAIYDPSGELTCLFYKYLQRTHNVYIVSPFVSQLNDRFGLQLEDAGFDLFWDFDLQAPSHTRRSYFQRKMERLIPSKPPTTGDEKSLFFRNHGRRLCEFFALYIASKGTKPTLPMMRSMLMEGLPALEERLIESTHSSAMDGILAETAHSLLGALQRAPEQFAGYMGVAEEALSLYDRHSEMGKHCAGKTFDPRCLKDDGRPTVVFISYPGETSLTHQQCLNVMTSSALETLAADPRRRRVTLILDEVASCGYLDNLIRAMNEYRKYGVRIVSLWQDLFGGQAEAIYTRAGMKQIVSAGEVTVAMSPREPETLEHLSKATGTVALEDGSITDRSRWGDIMPEQTVSTSNKTRPLMRPEEIRQMSLDDCLILAANLPPIKARKVPYWTRPEWRRAVGKNPYVNR